MPPRNHDPSQPALAMVVQLTRRSQRLSDRMIARLDRLESAEEDPDRLADLFELDHLVTQSRRNEEDLLVLAGATSSRVRRRPLALIDVLRAAQSEIEQYTRVEFGPVDDVEVAAPAAVDLIHLVAELLDNATEFSPSERSVLVEWRSGGTLTITDRGSGLKPDELAELNERLADPERLDPAALGLAVVARLAARHGIGVALRPASEGTTAEVTLPAALLTAVQGRAEPPPAPVRRLPAVPPVPLADQVRATVAAAVRRQVTEDDNGDLRVPAGEATVVVRTREDPPLVDVVSRLLTDVDGSGPLHARLAEVTARLPFGRVYHADGTVWATATVFGRDFQASHLRLALQVMTGLADDLAARLHEEFGGVRPPAP